jgi:hypothetical protein
MYVTNVHFVFCMTVSTSNDLKECEKLINCTLYFEQSRNTVEKIQFKIITIYCARSVFSWFVIILKFDIFIVPLRVVGRWRRMGMT